MKNSTKTLCVLLSLIMALSVFTVLPVGVSAAVSTETNVSNSPVETAIVTAYGFDGQSETREYSVGDTFTCYTFMNLTGVTSYEVACVDATQTYTDSVLSFTDDYDDDPKSDEYGMIKDVNTVFPIFKSKAFGNAGYPGIINYNASTTGSFRFNSDDSLLIVTRYTVTAPGRAEIRNSITTLADYLLTKIIYKGEFKTYKHDFVKAALSLPEIVIPTEAPTEPPTEPCGHWNTYSQQKNYHYYNDGYGYDLVTYCNDCGEELSRETMREYYPTEAPTVAPTEAPTEGSTEVQPCSHWRTYTKNENYSYDGRWNYYDEVTYCSYCGMELNRVRKIDCKHPYTHTKTENYQDYGDHGSYDLVTYCSDCGQELNREHKEVQYPTGDGVIYFDADSAGWEDASRIYFYIYEINSGAELAPWGSIYLSGTYVGNGKWAYDAAGVGVEPGKQYCLIMYNNNTGAQCYDLVMDSSCFGDTAYVTGKSIENPVDSNKSCIEARWRNSRLGPRKQITSIGNVVGETVPATTTPYKMFVGFLRNTLDNARWYSGKDEQCLIDDTAIALELNKNDVEKAISEAGAWVSWSYSDSTVPPPAPVDIPDEDGLILFDTRSAGWEDADAIMFDIYDLNDNRLPAKSTPDEIRGTKSHDGVWFFNAKERGVQDDQLYYIIFWNDNGTRTASLPLNSSCYGDKAYCDGTMTMEESPDRMAYYNDSKPQYNSYRTAIWANPHRFILNGTIGSKSLTWTLENGVLTISGNGTLDLKEPETADYVGSDVNYTPKSNHKKRLWNKLGFTDLVIEDGVTGISDNVFVDCFSLKTITIGNSVTSIGASAFENCSALESITIGNSVKNIGLSAFYDCDSLTSVTIGNSVTSIGPSAFYDCDSLTSVTIGNSVTKIDKYTFEDCDNLKNVTLGNSIYGIAAGAFYDCDNLESIILPDSVQIIADKAFSDCISLSSVTIPETVTDIGEKAFYNCPSLKNVTVPDSATNIDTKAFGYYYNNEFGITLRVPGFRLYGSVNSEAHRYAKAFGFRFERAVAMTGDADGDLMITVMDVTEVQRSLSSLSTTSDEDITRYADIDRNEVLEVIDATYILRYVGEKEIPYDIGQIQD